MLPHLRIVAIASFLFVVVCLPLAAQTSQEDSGWRIEPEKINIQMGEDRALQLLDDSAQELHDATWTVDKPDLATFEEQDGRLLLHATQVGMVVVKATWHGETRSREIKIWSSLRPLPNGTTRWSGHDFGRDIRDLAAVPTEDGPNMLNFEQFPDGNFYLMGTREDGIQLWAWQLPERADDAELICGDWIGGALISANHKDSYTLYAVSKDGELRWQRTLKGTRKGLADSTDHLIHLLNQSPDGTSVTVYGLDENLGTKYFELPVPVSYEKQVNLRREGSRIVCAKGTVSKPMPAMTSRIMVNMDGLAYLAFTQRDWTLSTTECSSGQALDPQKVNLVRDDKLVEWKIEPGGSFHTIVVEAMKNKQLLSAQAPEVSPTDAIITDNMNGTLISVRAFRDAHSGAASDAAEEFVYRVNQDGELVFKFPLPKYAGPLKDDMVIGENNVAFATRGNSLVAFNLISGKELWRWESDEAGISVFAALANGDCMVQTPTFLVEVAGPNNAKPVLKGQVLMDWRGNMYRKKD